MRPIRVRQEGSLGQVLVVEAPAELTHEVADDLREAVRSELARLDLAGVTLDMGEVSLISSIGIASMLQVLELCRDAAMPLMLVGVSDQQREFLKMLKLDRKFEMEPDLDEAIRRIEQQGG